MCSPMTQTPLQTHTHIHKYIKIIFYDVIKTYNGLPGSSGDWHLTFRKIKFMINAGLSPQQE